MEARIGGRDEIPQARRFDVTRELIRELESAVEERTGMGGLATSQRFKHRGRDAEFRRSFEHRDGRVLYTSSAEIIMDEADDETPATPLRLDLTSGLVGSYSEADRVRKVISLILN